MELHTVGVDGGYTQADVTALSAILTGWTADRPNQPGPFAFDPKKHEPGSKQWLGHTIGTATNTGAPEPALSSSKGSAASSPNLGLAGTNPSPGMNEGLEPLTLLTANPHTAHFTDYKVAQRCVAHDPPPPRLHRTAA